MASQRTNIRRLYSMDKNTAMKNKSRLQVGDRAKILNKRISGEAVGQVVIILAEEKINEFNSTFRVRFIDSNEQTYLNETYLKRLNRYAILKRTRNGQFRFTLIGDNYKVVGSCHTQKYNRKETAVSTLNEYYNSFRIVDKTKIK